MLQNILSYLTMTNVMAVLYLILLEGVLSVDNALALAALVHGRLTDPKDREKALRYGIWFAYIFRTLVVFGGVWLMNHEWVRWLAALYLVYISVKELFFKKEEGGEESTSLNVSFFTPLVSTILSVELMDIMFSIDSIAVSLSVSNKVPILVLGAVLGILMMRFAAQFLIKMIERFPILEKTAFILVLLSGLKIIASLLGVEVPDLVFMSLMFTLVIGSVAIGSRITAKE